VILLALTKSTQRDAKNYFFKRIKYCNFFNKINICVSVGLINIDRLHLMFDIKNVALKSVKSMLAKKKY